VLTSLERVALLCEYLLYLDKDPDHVEYDTALRKDRGSTFVRVMAPLFTGCN
jgi:hypothetical protein